jgi:hypothetical protein
LSPNPNGPSSVFEYKELQLQNVQNTNTLLVRFIFGKAENLNRLLKIIRTVPVAQNDPGWWCGSWYADALAAFENDGKVVGTSVLDWQRTEQTARRYVREKTAQGRFTTSALLLRAKPTWDMLENRKVLY